MVKNRRVDRLKPALFVDRDGVINEDRGYNYVKRWEEFVFLDGVKETLAQVNSQGIPVVLITNQSCIGKGLVSAETVAGIHQRVKEEIERAGGALAGVYVCPHTDEAECACRKPRPGLLLQAARDLQLDLRRSVFVGDSMRDMEAGRRAGVWTALVQSGKGAQQLELARESGLMPDFVCEQFEDVLDVLTKVTNRPSGKPESD